MKTKIVIGAPFVLPKYEFSRKPCHFFIDIQRMFTERSAVSCTSSILIFWLTKSRKFWWMPCHRNSKSHLSIQPGKMLLLPIISHSSGAQPEASLQEWSPAINSHFDIYVFKLSGSGRYSWNVIQEYLNVCVRAFCDIDWVFEIFHNRYIISDFKAIPAMAKSNQQRA